MNAMLQLSNVARASFYKAPLSTFKQEYWVNLEIKFKKAFCSVTFTRMTVGSCTVLLGQDCTQKLKTFDFLKLFHANDYHVWTAYLEWLRLPSSSCQLLLEESNLFVKHLYTYVWVKLEGMFYHFVVFRNSFFFLDPKFFANIYHDQRRTSCYGYESLFLNKNECFSSFFCENY